MKLNFESNTKLVVTLKKTMYFEPWKGTREVDLMSLDTVKEKFDCPKGPEMGKFQAANILAVKTLIGEFVDSTELENKMCIIKFKPDCCGLMHPDSEYFVMYSSDIICINEYELIPNEAMKLNFDMNAKLVVTLNETMYFKSWEGMREVDLMWMERLKQRLDCKDEPDVEKLKAANILATKMLIGEFVGARYRANKTHIIKIKAYCCGLMHPDSEYFKVYPSDIMSINEYKLIPNE